MLKILKDIGSYFLLISRVLSIPKKWSVFRKQLSLEFEKCVIINSKLTEEIEEIFSRILSSSFESNPNLFIPVSMCKILLIVDIIFYN